MRNRKCRKTQVSGDLAEKEMFSAGAQEAVLRRSSISAGRVCVTGFWMQR